MMEEGLPSHSVSRHLVAASSHHRRENDDTVDEFHDDDGSHADTLTEAVKELSLSESGAGEVPPSIKPKRRRKPRGSGSKHTPISESPPIDEPLSLSRHQDQKEKEHNYNEIFLSTTTTINPQQNQQHPKQKRSRRRKQESNPKSEQQQQQQDQCEQQQHQEVPEIHENDQNDDVHIDEDDDDYPSSMYMTAAITENKADHHDQQDHEVRISGKERKIPKRTIMEELTFLKRISSTRCQVDLGFVPNMKVRAEIIVNDDLEKLLVHELRESSSCCSTDLAARGEEAFIPSLRQVANVAALPGIVGASLAMPDVHSGYGFCIGAVSAFDMEDPLAVISPGGVGFDINCGVRLIRTNLTEAEVSGNVREELADAMFRNIPVGVGVNGDIPCNMEELDKILLEGINWAIDKGYAWEEDRDHCEDNGRMDTANPKCVSNRAKRRGLKQLGTLGAGNHYCEIQVVDEIYNLQAASTMGIGEIGQVCIMIHTGSRGLGHQVATDALTVMEKAMARDRIQLNDRQLSCARISSHEGKEYLSAMSSAANFAWVNRSCITYLTRKSFSEVFRLTPDEMDMHLVYDVCHNIAKIELHVVDGVEKKLLVHRKGSTRAFPPHHPNIPKDYQSIGQPVLIGGTMGTCSYVLVGTERGMLETFGSTCHGAGRALSRNQSRKTLDSSQVLDQLHKNNIVIRVTSPKLITEEAPESYKNVCDVIQTCQDAGISDKVVKLRPIAVIKG